MSAQHAAASDCIEALEDFGVSPLDPADPVMYHLHRSAQGSQILQLVGGIPPVRNVAANRPMVDEGPTGNRPYDRVAASPAGM